MIVQSPTISSSLELLSTLFQDDFSADEAARAEALEMADWLAQYFPRPLVMDSLVVQIRNRSNSEHEK